MTYGCELVNRLEFHAVELDDMSKERLLKAGVSSLTAAGDSESEVDCSILASDDHCGGLSLDILAIVCPIRSEQAR
jgi:hypothetical protein